MTEIHPTALVSPGASIGSDVCIGAYAIIGDHTVVGDGCRIEPHAQILPGVEMGSGNLIDRGAVIGGNPQSIGFNPATTSGVRIGNNNVIREHVTVHRSIRDGGFTVIGDGNFLMAGCHVGHDSVLGNQNVVANAVLIAGHVTTGNRCFLGGGAVFHQFIRIGDCAMAQGNSSFSADVPPYCIVSGLNTVNGLNATGLKRAGFTPAERLALRRAWHHVYRHPAGPARAAQEALDAANHEPPVRTFLTFLAATGPRGICSPPRNHTARGKGQEE